MQQEICAIDQKSKLFAFCQFIRRAYHKGNLPPSTSVCTLFWMTLLGLCFLVLSSPFILIGWISAKMGRQILKQDSDVTKYIETTFIGRWFADAPDDFDSMPLLSGYIYTGITSVLVALPVSLVITLYFAITSIAQISHFIVHCILYFGWGLFIFLCFPVYVLMGIRFAALSVWKTFLGQAWFWHIVGHGLFVLGSWICCAAAILLVLSAVGSVIVFLFMYAAKSSWGAKWLTYMRNGYDDVRKNRETERCEVKKKKEAEPAWACPRCDHSNWGIRDFCEICHHSHPARTDIMDIVLFNPCSWVSYKFGSVHFRISDLKLGERSYKVLSPITFAWAALSNFKKGFCPVVVFIDAEELAKAAKVFSQKLPHLSELLVHRGFATEEEIAQAKKSAYYYSKEDDWPEYLPKCSHCTKEQIEDTRNFRSFLKKERVLNGNTSVSNNTPASDGA